jgi:hypothetical protein
MRRARSTAWAVGTTPRARRTNSGWPSSPSRERSWASPWAGTDPARRRRRSASLRGTPPGRSAAGRETPDRRARGTSLPPRLPSTCLWLGAARSSGHLWLAGGVWCPSPVDT